MLRLCASVVDVAAASHTLAFVLMYACVCMLMWAQMSIGTLCSCLKELAEERIVHSVSRRVCVGGVSGVGGVGGVSGVSECVFICF